MNMEENCMGRGSLKRHRDATVCSKGTQRSAILTNHASPPSHVCTGIHNGGFFCKRKCVLCGLDLNIIQMRIKWPRLFKDDAGNVDSNTSEALMVSVFCSMASEWKYLSLHPLPLSSSFTCRHDVNGTVNSGSVKALDVLLLNKCMQGN